MKFVLLGLLGCAAKATANHHGWIVSTTGRRLETFLHPHFASVADEKRKQWSLLPSEISQTVLASLRRHRGLRMEENVLAHLDEHRILSQTSWALERISDADSIPASQRGDVYKANFMYTYDDSHLGADVDVYIVDTGVLCAHVDFGGRAYCPRSGVMAKGTSTNPSPGASHGTEMASAIGGNMWGVAKACNLISIKVMDNDGNIPLSNILDAFHWVGFQVEHNGHRRSLISVSLGIKVQSSFWNTLVESTIGIHRIPVVTSAGNTASDACGSSPNSAEGIVVVGGTRIDDTFMPLSSRGRCVTVLAPAEHLIVAFAGQSVYERSFVQLRTGTSHAAAYTAGVLAILLAMPSIPNPLRATRIGMLLQQNSLQNVITGIPDDFPGTPNYLVQSTFSLGSQAAQALKM
ncbi:hypothetical protein PYCC9005_003238 [Savitreella phatthalungensis]